METIRTTGQQGKLKKCIYLSSYKMQIEKEQPNENLQITPSLNPSCSKKSLQENFQNTVLHCIQKPLENCEQDYCII